MTTAASSELLTAARDGDRAALGRLLTLVERGAAPAIDGDDASYTVGITGAPGAGKSTLTAALIGHLRAAGSAVAVLAIDPSSPFSGGAILGDRVRMQHHSTDDGVYIRSMATRGHLGGLALAAPAALRVLGAAGYPVVLVETVGVGQVEVEVAAKADTTIVVVNPGWGDEVQAAKAGLMEIADVFVVNKADRPGTAETQADLERMSMLGATPDGSGWQPPVVATIATNGDGVDELWAAVQAHRAQSVASGELARRRRHRRGEEFRQAVIATIEQQARERAGTDAWRRIEAQVLDGILDPRAAARRLLGDADDARA